MRAARVLANIIGMAILAALAVLALFLVTFGLAYGAERSPAPGMTCTYTKQSAPFNGGARTYGVEVVGHFLSAQDERMRPWLWVKRPGDERYQSFLAVEADLSECRS